MSYIFPAAVMANAFSVTGLMIILGLAGNPVTAADFGIVHGATTALLYSFSANARSLILNRESPITSSTLLAVRALLVLPLGALSLWLSLRLGNVEVLLAMILVLRRCSEWIAEIHVSDIEISREVPRGTHFLLLQTFLFIIAAIWLLTDLPFRIPVLLAWATSPLWLSVGYVIYGMNIRSAIIGHRQILLPHFGSTAVIGISVYVFRLLILLLVGKAIAGDLFTAFAIGGLLGSVFAQAIGPSLALRDSDRKGAGFSRWLLLTLAAAAVAGFGIYVAATTTSPFIGMTGKSILFWQAVGASLIGGAVMVLAQQFRLRLLQHHADHDVFGPDVLSNILIVAAVPYVFFLLGINSLAFLYLLSAVLALVFYASAEKSLLAWKNTRQTSAPRLTTIIAALLLLPLFIQLDGTVFRDSSFIFDTEGLLSRLPLPVSVFACYGGILLLVRYTRAQLSLTAIFATFTLMLVSSALLSHVQVGQEQAKLILLMQYVLPMFALVLGQALPQGHEGPALVARGFLWVLATIMPLQLLATWLQGHVLLSPYLYLFSVYQHLQYAPVVFVAAYLMALYTFWDSPQHRQLLLWLGPLMGIYAGASVSTLAVAGLMAGLTGLAILTGRRKKNVRAAWLLALAVALCSGTYFSLTVGKFGGKFDLIHLQSDRDTASSTNAGGIAPRNLAERITYWKFYSAEILSSPKTAAIGHVAPPDRTKYPSAHNYYLDFAYNFGIFPLIPILGLLGLTLAGVFRQRHQLRDSMPYAGLAAIVLFLVVIDNSLKVGLRQPYPGILTFFLWGLLLARLFPEKPAESAQKSHEGAPT